MGEFLYSAIDGTLLNSIRPETKTYTQSAYRILIKLHYAEFGGYLLKVIYFALAMLTCYVISSGVMIWKTARDTSQYTDKQKRFHQYTDKQKRFHHRVTKFYVSLTSGLFPAIALIFIANKIFPISMEYRVVYVKTTFFLSWVLFIGIGLLWNNYAKINRNYIGIGSLLALLIPVFNGVVTGDWFWKTFAAQEYYIFSVDFAWLMTGVFGTLLYRLHLRPNNN